MANAGSLLYLSHGISKKELEKGTEFEIDVDRFSSDEECFEDETSNNFQDVFSKYCSSDNEEVNISSLSVEELKAKMSPLTEDGLVLKLGISAGSGPVIPPKSIVLMNYEAFVEGQVQPFDSTYKRNTPFKFVLDAGRAIYGFNLGVSTMRKGEIAKLWVHYSYAYGLVGCPPRIPECANILYDIEITNYFDCKDAIEFEEMLPDDQRSAPFEKVFAVCKVEHSIGNELFKNNKISASIPKYSRAVRLLETINAANEEEDKKRDSMLLKLYLNLSLCYLKLKKASRAICFAHKAVHLDDENIKALYRLGQAYELDGDFESARKHLLKAQKLDPFNGNLNNALIQLEAHYKKYENWNKSFCQKIFQVSPENARKETLSQEPLEFVEAIENRIKIFKESDESEYYFPSTFTDSQVEVIEAVAVSHELDFFKKIHRDQKIIKVKKKC